MVVQIVYSSSAFISAGGGEREHIMEILSVHTTWENMLIRGWGDCTRRDIVMRTGRRHSPQIFKGASSSKSMG